MLTGITTRPITPQEDAEPWPGGSARPVLAYLTGTLGMTDAGARELLKAARTAQAEAGPGTLADYPVPGGDARLLIHYAPGSRAYRFNLTTPGNDVPPGTSPEPGTAPGNQPRPHGPSRSPETPHGNPAGDPGDTPAPGLPAPAGGADQPGAAGITVTIWHNVAFDAQGRHTAMLDGYQPGDPMVCVFAYQASPGRSAEEIADEAFDTFNDHPRDPAARTWPAPTTGAGCGRCRSPETRRVGSGRVRLHRRADGYDGFIWPHHDGSMWLHLAES